MKNKFLVLGVMALLLVGNVLPAMAQSSATLSVGSGSGMPGDTGISIPVSLNSSAGTDISGINFDMTFDNSRLSVNTVTIGSSASSANKTLSYSNPSSGQIRVIIIGLNQDSIPNGTVANVIFDVSSEAATGTSTLALSNITASNPLGGGVAVSPSNGSFTVNSPPPPTSTPSNTPTSTNPPAATNTPVPSATRTSAPSLPTATRTRTNTPASTGGSTNTPRPSNTDDPPTTATATYTPSGNDDSASSPTVSPTVEVVMGGADASSGDPDAKVVALDIEAAVRATSTALAEIYGFMAETEAAVEATRSASEPPDPQPGSIFGFITGDALTDGLLLLGLSVMLGGAALTAYLIRRRNRLDAAVPEFTRATPLSPEPSSIDPGAPEA